MPIHIVLCGAHFIVTVTGDAEGGNSQPLKPPEICRGAPRLVEPGVGLPAVVEALSEDQPAPGGQLLTVAVRVVRVRWTTTVGAA